MKVISSEMWVNAFSEKPLAAKMEAKITKKNGKVVEYHAFHHFFKWMGYLRSLY